MNSIGSAGMTQTVVSASKANIWTPAGKMKVYVDHSVKTFKKEKKLNWFRKKFMEWSRRAWEDNQKDREENDVSVKSMMGNGNDSLSHGHKSIRFTVYSASGGHVIEYHVSNRSQDTWPVLSIVPHGENIGTAVEHIIAIEALKS